MGPKGIVFPCQDRVKLVVPPFLSVETFCAPLQHGLTFLAPPLVGVNPPVLGQIETATGQLC